MSDAFFEHPILNSPYGKPARHWELDANGQPTQQIIERRRGAEFITPIPKSKKQRGNGLQPQLVADANPELSRLALKLATGAGKTTVMASEC